MKKKISAKNAAIRVVQENARRATKRGRLIWDSDTQGTYVRSLHGQIGSR